MVKLRRKDYARFADAAYVGHGGKKIVNKHVRDTIGRDWEIDKRHSSRDYQTFVNNATKQVVVTHRGTKNLRDVKDDLAILFQREKYNKRFKKVGRNMDSVVENYKDYEIHSTGHSLGGSLAAFSTEKHDNVKTVAFSRGTTRIAEKGRSNLTDYFNPFDPISGLISSHKSKNKKTKRHSLNPHSLDQFL